MQITRNEFTALCAIKKHSGLTQRELAEITDLSLGTINGVSKSLQTKGLVEDGRITAKGASAIKPYKVDNAIIMAAGLSSRFAPISYEMPKGLLTVRGEILIERQIEQLHEAGITEIVLVVGYKKERFFYLEDKYGVQIVINKEFETRNNNSTLMRVRELLGNTYICSSDDYFTINPFESHVWKSYYAAEYSEGETAEWCMEPGRKDRIEKVTVGGRDAWYMIGHAYFDRDFSERFVKILVDEYDDPRTADKLWEQIFAEHLDELDMEIRRYDKESIFEFDSIDELKEFDPLFLDNLDSEIFDNIAAVLGCSKAEIHDVYPLKQGVTNLSCHFATSDGEYVYRHPGAGTEDHIDRRAEEEIQRIVRSSGLDKTFIFENPKYGWKVSRFLPNCTHLDPHDDAQLKLAMETARILHSQEAKIKREFSYFAEANAYEKSLLEEGPIVIPDFEAMKEEIGQLKAYVDADDARHCLCHNNFSKENMLMTGTDSMDLIDWEYAGTADYASDYGIFVVTCKLDEQEALRALEYYFDHAPTQKETRHCLAYVAIASWYGYVWALYKEQMGGVMGDWVYTYYSYAKKYAALALDMYEDEQE